MRRKCLKCHHANPSAAGTATEPCPACGAIYAKVEALASAEITAQQHATLPLDLVALRQTLGKAGQGPDVTLSPEHLMLLFAPVPSARQPRSVGGLGWGVFFGVMVGFIAMSLLSVQNVGPLEPFPGEQAPPPTSASAIDIVPRSLLDALRTDPEKTLAYWNGRNVRLRAPLIAVSSHLPATKDVPRRQVLKLHSGDPRRPVLAELLPEVSSAASGLDVGESVTVVCSTVRWNRVALWVKGCQLGG